MKKKINKIIVALTSVLLILGTTASNIIVNISESSPVGIYLIDRFNKDYGVNDYVIYETPQDYKKYADKKLQNLMTIKKIKAIEGDRITIVQNVLYINRNEEVPIKYDIPVKIKNHRLEKDEYLTLSDNENSLDGRYYGVINKKNIKYRAHLLFKI